MVVRGTNTRLGQRGNVSNKRASKIVSVVNALIQLYRHDSPKRKNTPLYQALQKFLQGYRAQNGFNGTDLVKWHDTEHQEALHEAVVAFLDTGGQGRLFWPDEETMYSNPLKYSVDAEYIKGIMMELACGLNQEEHKKQRGRESRSVRSRKQINDVAVPSAVVPGPQRQSCTRCGGARHSFPVQNCSHKDNDTNSDQSLHCAATTLNVNAQVMATITRIHPDTTNQPVDQGQGPSHDVVPDGCSGQSTQTLNEQAQQSIESRQRNTESPPWNTFESDYLHLSARPRKKPRKKDFLYGTEYNYAMGLGRAKAMKNAKSRARKLAVVEEHRLEPPAVEARSTPNSEQPVQNRVMTIPKQSTSKSNGSQKKATASSRQSSREQMPPPPRPLPPAVRSKGKGPNVHILKCVTVGPGVERTWDTDKSSFTMRSLEQFGKSHDSWCQLEDSIKGFRCILEGDGISRDDLIPKGDEDRFQEMRRRFSKRIWDHVHQTKRDSTKPLFFSLQINPIWDVGAGHARREQTPYL